MPATAPCSRARPAGLMAALLVVCLPPGASGQAAQNPARPALFAFLPGNGVEMPIAKQRVPPTYPGEAAAAGIRGEVELAVIVAADGTVADARVTKSLAAGFGFDREALEAARRWRFIPGQTASEPVAVLVRLIMEFRPPPRPDRAAEVSARLSQVPRVARTSPAPFETAIDTDASETPGFTDPRVVWHIKPNYTSAALRALITGEVEVDIVIAEDGTVVAARVANSRVRDWGLEQEALAAAHQWRFEPATLDGRPVAARATLVLEFRLH